MGFIFSTKRLMSQVTRCIEAQGTTLTAMVDGTYKVSTQSWVIANIGICCCYYNTNENKYSKTFLMAGLCFMQAKTKAAYLEFCTRLSEKISQYTGFNFAPRFVISDHSDAIASGTLIAWPDSKILKCWPHLTRNLSKNLHRLKNAENAKKVTAHVYFLHHLPTHDAFQNLVPAVLAIGKICCMKMTLRNGFIKLTY